MCIPHVTVYCLIEAFIIHKHDLDACLCYDVQLLSGGITAGFAQERLPRIMPHISGVL